MHRFVLACSLLTSSAAAVNLSQLDAKEVCYFDIPAISDRRTASDPLGLGASYPLARLLKDFDAQGIKPFFVGCRYGIFFSADYTFWPSGTFLLSADVSLSDLSKNGEGVKQHWTTNRQTTTSLQAERLQQIDLALTIAASAFLSDWREAHPRP